MSTASINTDSTVATVATAGTSETPQHVRIARVTENNNNLIHDNRNADSNSVQNSVNSPPSRRKPSLLRRIFGKSQSQTSKSNPTLERKLSLDNRRASSSSLAPSESINREIFTNSRGRNSMGNGSFSPSKHNTNPMGRFDERSFDENSEGELDLHHIMSDEADEFSQNGGHDSGLTLLDNSSDIDTRALLANVSADDLKFPKYVKATRKSNKSPRVFNNLFLAQELRCGRPDADDFDRRSSEMELQAHAGGDVNVDVEDNCDGKQGSRKPCNVPNKGSKDNTKVPMEPNEILVMEFSRDGKYLAVAGRDSKITVWQVISSPLSRLKFKNIEADRDASPSKKDKQKVFDGAPVFLQSPVRVFEGHTKSVLCLDWSKNNFLLSGSMDRTVKLWNIERAECLDTFQHQDFVTALRFHPNDDRFFISGALDNQLRLWSILERSVAYTNDLGDHALITALEFTPYGNFCMVGGFNGSLFALETQGLHLVKRIELRKKSKSHLSRPSSTTVSGIKFFENPTCEEIPSSDLSKYQALITTNDSTIRLVDLSLRKLVTRFRGNDNQSSAIAARLSEDNRYIICGSDDHCCYVWDNNNSIINNKLRSSMKELLLERKISLDEKHKSISKILHDNSLWKKLPIQMFLEDENGKKYIANDNTSYSSFHAHQSRVNVALFAPETTKRLLKFSDDKIFDLVKRGTKLAQSRGGDFGGESAWGSDHIVVTSDVTGLIRVYRQDPAYFIRKNLLEFQKMSKRDRARTSHDSPLPSPDVPTFSFDSNIKQQKSARTRSKSPTLESTSGLKNKIHEKIRTRANRSNSDLSTTMRSL